MSAPTPADPKRARFEALLAQKGGHRLRGGKADASATADARPSESGPTRERPAAPARTFRRKV